MDIPIVVQHRHVHLSPEDTLALFGVAHPTGGRSLDQRDQFAYGQTVSVHGPSGSFPEVSVLGPARSSTQVELSSSDAFAIGINAPLRLSGDLNRSATVILKTQNGEIKANMSTIVPIRHLHLPPVQATALGLSHHDVVTLKMKGQEEVIFPHVVVRVHPTFLPAFHLTKDEASAHWIQTGDTAIV